MGQRDIDRVLTIAGQTQASRVGEYLKNMSIRPDLILTSNAVRAASTAIIVSGRIGYSPDKITEMEIIYAASLISLLSVIKEIEDRFNCILLVGHNPSISTMGEFLTEEHVGNVDSAGLLSIEFKLSNWKKVARGSGKLISIINA